MSCAGCEDCSLVQMAGAISPFEIHITVKKGILFSHFQKICEELGVKALLIWNYNRDGDIIHDWMTRSVIRGSVADAYKEMHLVSFGLGDAGIEVVRNKIETVPWLYDSLQKTKPYFETHIEVSVKSSKIHCIYNENVLDFVIDMAHKLGGYVSQNSNKPDTAMITFRMDHVNDYEFKMYVKRMRSVLGSSLYIGKEIIEMTIHDDNKSHDDSWLNG